MDRSKRQISLLTSIDPYIKDLSIKYSKEKDQIHVQKRKQQRAITDEMIKIALIYGLKSWTYGKVKYVLTDRCLKSTLYYPFLDKLRGLTVIGDRQFNSECSILTTYWDTQVRSRKSNCENDNHH